MSATGDHNKNTKQNQKIIKSFHGLTSSPLAFLVSLLCFPNQNPTIIETILFKTSGISICFKTKKQNVPKNIAAKKVVGFKISWITSVSSSNIYDKKSNNAFIPDPPL